MAALNPIPSSEDTIEDVLNLTNELVRTSGNGDYLFRGEPRHYSKVSSTLYRHYQRIPNASFNIEAVQDEVITEARNYATKDGDLEILGELQHYGGRTNLIDFTTDCLIALFFASDGFPEQDGRVVLVKHTSESPEYSVYPPHNPSHRVIAQKSVFVRPKVGYVEPDVTVSVPASLKLPILNYLRTRHGISTETIYNDLHGFIRLQELHQNAYVEFYAGRSDLDQGNDAEAITHFSNAIALNPQFFSAYNSRGVAYARQGATEPALQNYNIALSLDANRLTVYNNRAILLFRIGDSEAAIRDYNAVLAIDPSNAQAYRSRGFLHHYQGDIVNALRDLNKALELSPNDGRCFVHRGFVWLSLSEWSRAKQELMLGSESVDVATLITDLYGTISAFEQRHDVELPEDIVGILTSTSREHLPTEG